MSRSDAEEPLRVASEAEPADASDGQGLGALTIAGTAAWCEHRVDAPEDVGPIDTDDTGTDADDDGTRSNPDDGPHGTERSDDLRDRVEGSTTLSAQEKERDLVP